MGVKKTFPAVAVFMLAFLMSGCMWLKTYGRLASPSINGHRVTVEDLKQNWDDYTVYYTGMSPGNPGGVIFDPKEDNRALVGDRWVKVENQETVSKIIYGVRTDIEFFPALYMILGPDDQFYGYLYFSWGFPVFKVIDDKTLYVYELQSPVYIEDYDIRPE